jgi:hypothetical protein
LIGKFENGIGVFNQVVETLDGKPLQMRFTWDEITENTARWQQAFSFDGGTIVALFSERDLARGE